MNLLNSKFSLFKRILQIVFLFGKRQIILLWILILLQGIIQVLGVFSIMPFLAIVNNPNKALESAMVQKIMQTIPFFEADHLVLIVGIFTITLLIASSVVNGVTDFLKARYAHFTCMRIGTYLLTSYASQSYIFYINHNSAELIKRLQSDVNMFMGAVLLPFLELISRSVNVVLILIILFVVSPIAGGMAFLVFGSFLGLTFLVFRLALIRGNNERKVLISQRFISAHQLLMGIKTVMIHECQKHFISDYYRSSKRIAQLDSSLAVIGNTPKYIIEAIAFSSVIIIVLVCQSQGVALETILPFMAFFVLAAYRIMPSLQLIYRQLTQIQSQKFTVDILYKDLIEMNNSINFNRNPELRAWQPTELQERIVFENVSFAYPNAQKLSLNEVNLSIKKGQRIGFVGYSGSGKSTLIDLLIGLLNPSSGKILIDGVELTPARYANWHRLVGYVAQDIFLTDESIRQNIAFGIAESNIVDTQVIYSAKIAQIHDFIQADFPLKYNTECGERGIRLSGGQKQRIALARALYHQPSVLVFDEATSALDSETERKLIAEIEELPEDLTIVMVAHRLSTVEKCDVIFVLEQGKIVAQGTYEQLLDKSSIFQKLAASIN
ncbi:ABC transporter ATP-binding protein [Waterburya agarophytonicola K14]|uniref:ABC transporter ATP-binding protein n=1 Tax=Waterburya agarophytonicola KI4 TaxID=2874699 RepID=A0A964FI64_9CYAN|nr:ABC transporter ATP-binding protein [Waterburya agarophytonicola]MCC0179592.1 ABC transporter ATP-binding protein [Waterburya agarophytonicola KI4]